MGEASQGSEDAAEDDELQHPQCVLCCTELCCTGDLHIRLCNIFDLLEAKDMSFFCHGPGCREMV